MSLKVMNDHPACTEAHDASSRGLSHRKYAAASIM
jgi:hypothetical protein